MCPICSPNCQAVDLCDLSEIIAEDRARKRIAATGCADAASCKAANCDDCPGMTDTDME